jgi:hypothetical protein
MVNGNPIILRRLDELITEGERVFKESTEAKGGPVDSVSLARWITAKHLEAVAKMRMTPPTVASSLTVRSRFLKRCLKSERL